MRQTLKQSLLIYLLLTIVCGVIYPLTITAIAQCAWSDKANGSLIIDRASGKVIGSHLLGQEFTSAGYFWGRVSATSPPYNAAASSGSNLGPTNQALAEQIKKRIDVLAKHAKSKLVVPVDLVTSSGSGLDPDISVASAELQVTRVANARGMREEQVLAQVKEHVKGRQFGLLGEARINVMELNLALDGLASRKPGTE